MGENGGVLFIESILYDGFPFIYLLVKATPTC